MGQSAADLFEEAVQAVADGTADYTKFPDAEECVGDIDAARQLFTEALNRRTGRDIGGSSSERQIKQAYDAEQRSLASLVLGN